MENNKNYEEFALEFYEKAMMYSYTYPVDKFFIDDNLGTLKKNEYLEILIFSINNLPNIYVSKFMLLTLDFLILFDMQDWEYLYKKIANIPSHNTIISFFVSYLNLLPSADLLKMTSFKYDYIYEKDDDYFIEDNCLNSQLEYLQTRLLSLNFIPFSKGKLYIE